MSTEVLSTLSTVRLSDAELLAACRRRESSAWDELVTRYEGLVYSIALNSGLVPAECEDVTQQVFESLLRALDRIDTVDNMAAWLGTVTRRTVWRIKSAHAREHAQAGLVGQEMESLREQAGERVDTSVLVESAFSALEQVGDRCRRLLLALYFEGNEVAYEDIASRLGMPLGSVGPTRARCLDKLRRLLIGEHA